MEGKTISRITFESLLISILLLTASFSFSATVNADKIKSSTLLGTTTISNGILDAHIEDNLLGQGFGTYTISTGSNHSSPGENVFYGGAGANPWSTYNTIHVNDTLREYVTTTSVPVPDLSYTLIDLDSCNPTIASTSTKTIVTWTTIENLEVIQETQVIGTMTSDTKVRVTMKVTNNDFVAHTVGIRYEWDLMIDGWNGSWLRQWVDPNTPGSWLDKETDWVTPAFPFWEATNFPTSLFSVYGSVSTPTGSTPPDRLVFAHWLSSYSRAYSYTPTGIVIGSPEPTVGGQYDSAVLYYWNPTNINPGESRTVTAYVTTFIEAVAPIDWWPMAQHDARRTGYSTSLAPNTNSTLWTYATGGVAAQSVVADGKVYVSLYDRKVYALNAFTGALIWNYTTGGPVWSVAVCYGRVFAPSGDGKLYALNATTGAFDWSYQIDARYLVNFADGKVYIGSRYPDNKLYALNATTGAYVWSFQVGGDNGVGHASLADGRVFFGAGDWKIYALNASTGTFIWSYQTGGYTIYSCSVVNGKVFTGSNDGKVYALNVTDGSLIWNYTTGYGTCWHMPAVAYDNVFIGSYNRNFIVALSTTTGALIWNYTTGGGVSTPAVADGKVYIGSGDHKVYALNVTDGSLIWSYATGGSAGYPAVADGKVYIGSWDGKVYAFGPAHDVAVTNVTPSKTVVGQGYSLNINVTAANQGDYTETFNVTVHANTTTIATTTNITLPSGNFTTLTFTWNSSGFVKGNYTISAYAMPVRYEIDTADNNCTGDVVEVLWKGDVNKDDVVDGQDAVIIIDAIPSVPGHPNWNPYADVNGDNVVDGQDAVICIDLIPKTYP